MKKNPSIRIGKTVFCIIYIFLLSLSTSYNKDIVIDGKISAYVESQNNEKSKYIHSETHFNAGEELSSFNVESKKMVDFTRTDFKTYSSYLTLNKGNTDAFLLTNQNYELEFSSKVMWFSFRQDMNRTFMESIRLRQYRQNVESRSINSGFDFSFYVSSIMADQIITSSNGELNNYDEILDYNDIGLDFALDVDGDPKHGHIKNIYYIEETNHISKSLYYYNDDFIIMYGPIDQIFSGYEKVLNYDFLTTNISIENNLSFLNQIDFGETMIYDTNLDIPNLKLHEISAFMLAPYAIPTQGIFVIIMTSILSVLILVYCLLVKRYFFTRLHLIDTSFFILILVIYHVLLKLFSYFYFSSYFSFTLSNYIFGFLTLMMMLFQGYYYYIYYRKLLAFKKKMVIENDQNH